MIKLLFLISMVFGVSFLGCDNKGKTGTGKDKTDKSTPTSNDKGRPRGGMGNLYDQMADADWESPVKSGEAKLRFIVKVDGQPLQGSTSMQGEFKFTATQLRLQEGTEEQEFESAGKLSQQSFNPSSKGRFVHSDLEAGYYNVEIKDTQGRYKTWTKEKVNLGDKQTLTFDVNLEKK